MIGVSLPFSWFWEKESKELISFLKALITEGVESIELRTVRAHHDPLLVKEAVQTLWNLNLHCTIHSEMKSEESVLQDVFGPLSLLLKEDFHQQSINLTVHPIMGDNTAALCALADCIDENHYPLTVTLENNRRMPDKSEGDSVALVLDAVKKVSRDKVRLCLDLGHHAYYQKKFFPEEKELLLPEDLWQWVGHTHIHGMDGLRTHFPLGESELNLEEYLQKLSFEYFGVFNIELEFSRFPERFEPLDALRRSVGYLRERLCHCTRIYQRTRHEFDDAMHRALSLWEKGRTSGVSLIHSTSYLFRTKDFFWGMDLAFRHARHLCSTPGSIADLTKDLRLMILTHKHRDHFEPDTLRELAKNDTLFLIPDFMKENALEGGLPSEKCIFAQANVPVTIGPLTILPFTSCHYRNGNGRGVKEYGYYITAEGEPSLVFPGDIRHYSREHSRSIPPADYCFAHLWLGDDNCDWEDCKKRILPFSEYMLGFSRKHLILTHLYENGRPDDKMWRMEHADPVLKQIHALSPETKIFVPDWGETILF